MIFAERVLLVVIGSQEELRSSSLQALVSQMTRSIFVEPVLINAGDRILNCIDEHQSELVYGRRLSDSEVGCAIAHRNAVSKAYEEFGRDSMLEWALIVEDDANLDATTLGRIRAELIAAQLSLPSLVSFYSAKMPRDTRSLDAPDTTNSLKVYRQWVAGAVCYAVNQRGLADIHSFSTQPISCIADWPLHYSRLKFLKSVYTRVSEVEGRSSIGYRPRLGVGKRLVLHIRQLWHIRKIAVNYGVTVLAAVNQLILFPAWRDSRARLELITRLFRFRTGRIDLKM